MATGKAITLTLLLFPLLLLLATLYLSEHYLLTSTILILLIILPFLLRFELKKQSSKTLVFIALIIAIAAISRVPFAGIPSVQPTTFFIIVSALVLGAERGFLIGALAALVSNLFLGQGPWTLWQMFAWGLVGYSAGMLQIVLLNNKWLLLLFGLFWGFLFGWIMNLYYVLSFIQTLTWELFLTSYIMSFPFDLAHALSNLFFLALFTGVWLKILQRFQRKYLGSGLSSGVSQFNRRFKIPPSK